MREAGYEVLLNIGDLEENRIGSNCGQHVRTYLARKRCLAEGDSYWDAAPDLPADR